MLSRAIDAVRVWIGLNDPAENHLHPSHGWLLPAPADIHAPALRPAPTPRPAAVTSPSGECR